MYKTETNNIRWSEEDVFRAEPWMKEALCAETDPEIFFPEKYESVAATAKKVCAECDVAKQCLEYALRNNEQYGIWGGLSLIERRALKRQSGTV
jgi:WhiB family redox-sensing transcriptional regulator